MEKGKQAKGQAATEYILTAAVIGIMILPAAYLFYTYAQSSADQIDKAQLDKMGRDIMSAAESVYYQGAPSRTILETRMPNGVTNISVIGDWNSGTQELILTAYSNGVVNDFSYPSSININGSFNGSLNEISSSAGLKKIAIEAYDTQPDSNGVTTSFVNINFGGRCPRSVTYDFNTDGVYTATDAAFLNQCYCGTRPKYRPEKTWQSGWFDNNGFAGGNPYAVCMNADYNGDCIIDDTDQAQFCAVTGFACSPFSCS